MKLHYLLAGVVVGVVSVLVLGPVSAQEGEGGGTPAWKKLTKEHESFKKGVGDWEYTMKWWMAPGMPPTEGKGTSSAKLLWKGNYLTEDSEGSFNMMGQTINFKGKFFLGFDTVDKEYVAIWLNSGSPVPSITRGTEKDGVIWFEGMEPDHASPTGKKKKTKMALAWDGDDRHTLTFYDVNPDGTDRKAGEIVYTRKKEGGGQ